MSSIIPLFALTSAVLYVAHKLLGVGDVLLRCHGDVLFPFADGLVEDDQSKVVLFMKVVQNGQKSFPGLS